jgi:MFS transporter, ACS family, tartrate transporter
MSDVGQAAAVEHADHVPVRPGAAAAGLAAINSIGNLGGFAGPAMIGWIKSLTGSFAAGLYFVCGLLIVSAIVTFLVSRSVVRPSVIVKPV